MFSTPGNISSNISFSVAENRRFQSVGEHEREGTETVREKRCHKTIIDLKGRHVLLDLFPEIFGGS